MVNNLIEIIGWIGAILLATCGLPQLYTTLKSRNFSGLSLLFIGWWFVGEILSLTYIVYVAFKWPLLFNYAINILVCIVIFIMYFILRKK